MAALTIAALRRFERDPETLDLRAQAIILRKLAAKRRAEVDAYIAPVFARFTFYVDRWPEQRDGKPSGEPIAKPADLYLSADEAGCAAFYAACDLAHREHGYQLPEGHCPALRAENDAIRAERALLLHAAKSLGIDGLEDTYGELRDKALALFLDPPKVQRPSHTARGSQPIRVDLEPQP